VTPAVAAGLSLGEYAALVCAGALDLAQALRLVRLRGIFMQEAVSGRRTAMAAIVGLDAAAVERVCAEASARGVVEPANFNSPGQVVIAGDEEAVEDGIARARAAGARRAVRLAVSAPFHTSLMRPAARRLAEVLAGVPLRDARIPVVSNVTAAPVRRADDIRRLLAEQVASPVRWEMSVRAMAAGGVTTFVEVGPGTTLAGMVRKTVPDARVLHVDGPATLQQTLRALPEAQGGGPGAAGGAHG
jgi:[acyl-carrier-protein] S-malonyltransferase